MEDHFVYTLYDANGLPVFVEAGKLDCPRALWQASFDARPSELSFWLSTLAEAPRHTSLLPIPVYRALAVSLATSERRRLRKLGYKLLSRRALDRIGSHFTARRGVVSPKGDAYGSVREAARAERVAPSTIMRRCHQPRSRWHYV